MLLATRERRFVRVIRLAHFRSATAPIYQAGDTAPPGVYEDVERKINVRLSQVMPLPDLNSYQPSRFSRRNAAGGLLRRLIQPRASVDPLPLYLAGQPVPAGIYVDLERGVEVRLSSDGRLPDLQTGVPSRYRRVRGGGFRVRRRGIPAS